MSAAPDESRKAKQKVRVPAREAFPRERATFKTLLLSNPNYFGNLKESPLTAVLPISSSTYYEELACVGYHPQHERLEAVVYVYQPTGYGTDICGPGTQEYVRFYLSYDNGTTWQDQGMTGFQAYNIPEGTEGGKRLEYAVSLAIDPQQKLCFASPLVLMRAILSWNNPPPANQPNWIPVWGNVREATILVEPRRLIFLPELFELTQAKLPASIQDLLDLQTTLPTTPKALSTTELSALYRNQNIPVHRFAYKELAAFAQGQIAVTAEAYLSQLQGIQIDPAISDLLFPKTDGDTSYEELKCIGLDPNLPDTLVGVIQIKKPSGFSGGPCTSGSREYVTFWADFDGNGSFETCLGTAEVQVYDVVNIPPDGVHYAVHLPVDLSPYRQPCQQGPKVVRIRAVLSWNVPAPCANPNYVPAWGNREETLIHIAPTAGAPAGKIAILGGIPVSHINPVTGYTTSSAVFATNNLPPDALGRPCPFGGRVTVQGAPVAGHSYIVEVSQDNVLWTPVLTNLIVTDQDGNTSVHSADPATLRFQYLPFNQNINSVLAQWNTTGDAKWWVRLSVYNGGGVLQSTDTHVIQLDNTAPEVSITITSGTGDCGKFPVGSVLGGNFVARDDYLGHYSLSVEPAINPPAVGVPSPSSGITNTPPAPGATWSLNTAGMQPCGYVIRLVAVDRTIVNSQSVGHYASDSAGFCLEEADDEPS